jgi:hypothetical protein
MNSTSRLTTALVLAFAGAITAWAHPALAAFSTAARVDYPVQTGPTTIATGDLNGDGIPDMVVANTTTGSFSVFLGNGGGGFGPRTDVFADGNPKDIALADLNGDGKLDLVVLPNGSNFIEVMLGNGLGGFGVDTHFNIEAGATSLKLADVNGDGRLDAIVPATSTNDVSVLLGDGNGGFGPAITSHVGNGPTAVAVADFDHDGKLDLAITTDSLIVLRGDGTGHFSSLSRTGVAAGPVSVAAADLNGDGAPDLVVGSLGTVEASVLLNDSYGNFTLHVGISLFASTTALTDIDGDGKCDFILAGQNGIYVVLGDGNGGFSSAPTQIQTTAQRVFVADMNGDGRPDLLGANNSLNTVSVILGGGGTQFLAKSDYGTPGQTRWVAAGDLNGDGKLDLVSCNTGANSITPFLGNGIGGLSARTSVSVGSSPFAVVLADFNGDGNLDAATANSSSNNVSVVLGNGSGTFDPTTRVDYPAGTQPLSIAAADVNGDGRLDLIVANGSSNNVGVLLANSSGSGFNSMTTTPCGTDPIFVATADFNGDGKLDIVTANFNAASVTILLGNGTGSFPTRTDLSVGTNPTSVAIGDLNGDGKLDLAVADNGSNAISIYLGNGDGTFTASTGVTTGCGPFAVAMADLNGDGKQDLAVSGLCQNGISVVLGDGTGKFGPLYTYATGGGPSGLIASDLNGDGKPDLVAANYNSNSLSVLLAPEPTRTTLSLSPNPGLFNLPVTVTASVTPRPPGTGTPTGSVRFFDGTTLIGTATLSGGQAAIAPFSFILGSHPLTAVYLGDTKFSGSSTTTAAERIAASAAPTITNIVDVRNDQGRVVRVDFTGSAFDSPGSSTPITGYEVFRREIVTAPAAAPSSIVKDAMAPELAGWDYLMTVPADAEQVYQTVVPTLADSNGTGLHNTVLFVRAATASLSLYYDSAADSGYSVDNLPPAAPAPFTAAYLSGATHLHWGPNSEADFWYYRLYRGSDPSFVPSPANLIAAQADTGYADVGAAGSTYKISAVDVNGNESAFSVVTPQTTTGIGDGRPFVLALEPIRPNPTTASRLSVFFILPRAGDATLELVDISGRVWAQETQSLNAGPHAASLAAERQLPAGVYFVRLSEAGKSTVERFTILGR